MKALLLAWIAFSGLALIALNAAVMIAWIDLKRHGKRLRQHGRRLASMEEHLMRLNRQAHGLSEADWAAWLQRLATEETAP